MKLDLGAVVLGGNVFGWTVKTPAEAFRIFDAFVAGGGRAIDTADVYPAWVPGNEGGESESFLGQWLAQSGKRHQVVVATKVAKWAKHPGLSAKNLRAAVEGSLKRLRTDVIDLYYAHEDDLQTPQEAYVTAFDALVKEGKVRALGASNFTAARLTSAVELARQHGLAAFEYSQDKYSLVERGLEQTLIPTLQRLRLHELPYASLASGFLTGKYRPGAKVDSARAQGAGRYLEDPENVKLLERLEALAAKHGVSVAAVALAWVRARPTVAAPIASARTVEQLGPLLESARVTLDPTALA